MPDEVGPPTLSRPIQLRVFWRIRRVIDAGQKRNTDYDKNADDPPSSSWQSPLEVSTATAPTPVSNAMRRLTLIYRKVLNNEVTGFALSLVNSVALHAASKLQKLGRRSWRRCMPLLVDEQERNGHNKCNQASHSLIEPEDLARVIELFPS